MARTERRSSGRTQSGLLTARDPAAALDHGSACGRARNISGTCMGHRHGAAMNRTAPCASCSNGALSETSIGAGSRSGRSDCTRCSAEPTATIRGATSMHTVSPEAIGAVVGCVNAAAVSYAPEPENAPAPVRRSQPGRRPLLEAGEDRIASKFELAQIRTRATSPATCSLCTQCG